MNGKCNWNVTHDDFRRDWLLIGGRTPLSWIFERFSIYYPQRVSTPYCRNSYWRLLMPLLWAKNRSFICQSVDPRWAFQFFSITQTRKLLENPPPKKKRGVEFVYIFLSFAFAFAFSFLFLILACVAVFVCFITLFRDKGCLEGGIYYMFYDSFVVDIIGLTPIHIPTDFNTVSPFWPRNSQSHSLSQSLSHSQSHSHSAYTRTQFRTLTESFLYLEYENFVFRFGKNKKVEERKLCRVSLNFQCVNVVAPPTWPVFHYMNTFNTTSIQWVRIRRQRVPMYMRTVNVSAIHRINERWNVNKIFAFSYLANSSALPLFLSHCSMQIYGASRTYIHMYVHIIFSFAFVKYYTLFYSRHKLIVLLGVENR